jgi:tetratricopeptide (TPR) repeat protein
MENTNQLEKKALQAAKKADWKMAIDLNITYLKQKPTDTAALNRLARAYVETGQIRKAVWMYKKVLELDQFNQIAERNFKKLTCSGQRKINPQKGIVDVSFLEVKGKTKVVKLIKPAASELLTTLHVAEEVQICPRGKSVVIKDGADRYLGALPDDIGFRLNRLIKEGNRYQACVKGIDQKEICIFIKEVHRTPVMVKTPSFIS